MRSAALIVSVVLLWMPPDSLLAQRPARIVAIGDIHGEYEGFKRILQAAGLGDANGRWTGGRAQLIQFGDYTDVGIVTRAVVDLLTALELYAHLVVGRALALLGDHEVMNLILGSRYVTAEIFATFADASSETKRNLS